MNADEVTKMKHKSTHEGELILIERLPNSRSGNPRYLLHCEGVSFRTRVDAAHGYEVPNFFGKRVRVTVGTHYGVCQLDRIESVQ